MDMNGWDGLLCDYFNGTCTHVLQRLFEAEGFSLTDEGPAGNVVFTRNDVFVELGYVVESSPSYSPTVVIGFGNSKYVTSGVIMCVPLWFIVRRDGVSADYSFWTFASEEELKNVFERIYGQVILRYAKPLWLDPGKLGDMLIKFRSVSS